MMTKKDFVELAEQFELALQQYRPGTIARKAAVAMIEAAATACKRININFDRARFYQMCGVSDEDVK